MLRIGIASATTRHWALASRSSSLGICERYWSSKAVDEDTRAELEKPKSLGLRRPEGSDGGTDALRVFFEKRRAALQKEQQATGSKQQQQQRQQSPRQDNRWNKRIKSNASAVANSTDTNQNQNNNNDRGGNHRQSRNPDDRPRNNNNNNRQFNNINNNNNSNSNSNSNNNNNRQNQPPPARRPENRRGSHQPQNQQRDQDTTRLAELIQQLRRDAPAKSTRHQPGPSPIREQQPALRQRFQRQQQQHQQGGKAPPRFRRPFLTRPGQQQQQQQQQPNDEDDKLSRRGQRHARRQANQQAPQRFGEEFLQGRMPRSDDADQLIEDKDDGEMLRIITLPTKKTSLVDASTLFRIKMDTIKRKLRNLGERVSDDMSLDVDLMELVAMEFGIDTVRGEGVEVANSEQLLIKQRRVEEAVAFPPRPPVVCIMGHVDHGKTTLMDALRRQSLEQDQPKSKGGKKKKGTPGRLSKDVAGTEAGGITQIISAFQVVIEGQDNKVTFLDTPGHAAFKTMRQSGSHAADVIVLVVAADDGVSEQTIEILDFYKSIVKGSDGGITMVVALNKIDKPGVDVDEAKRRIENQLLEHGIITEGMHSTESEYGPPVQVIPTSGLTGHGLDDLMEGLVLQSEVMDLRADAEALAEGIIMDARLEKGLGVVADGIVRWGSIHQGDIVVSGTQIARVRMLKDVSDKMLKTGLPSQPVRIVGFKSLPKAGDPIMCVESEEIAEEIVAQRALVDVGNERPDAPRDDIEIHITGMKSRDTRRSKRVLDLADLEESDGTIRIPIVVKADADGSLSAVRDSLVNLGKDSSYQVLIDPILEGIGEITATDIQMAKESEATIFAFGLQRIDQAMLNLAEQEEVTIRNNDIIYSLLDEAKDVLGKYLPREAVEHLHGRAEVQAIFDVGTDDGDDKIAGLKVTDGHMYKEMAPLNGAEIRCNFRVLRDGAQVSPEGDTLSASSLRRFKELVDSVRRGDECGLGLSGFSKFEEGDVIECYSVEMKNASL